MYINYLLMLIRAREENPIGVMRGFEFLRFEKPLRGF